MLLLLQMINISIDPVRHLNFINGMPTYQEDLSINKIESMYELVLENLFDQDVPETQDIDNDALQKTIFICHKINLALTEIISYDHSVVHNHHYKSHSTLFYPQLDSPPPKV